MAFVVGEMHLKGMGSCYRRGDGDKDGGNISKAEGMR